MKRLKCIKEEFQQLKNHKNFNQLEKWGFKTEEEALSFSKSELEKLEEKESE